MTSTDGTWAGDGVALGARFQRDGDDRGLEDTCLPRRADPLRRGEEGGEEGSEAGVVGCGLIDVFPGLTRQIELLAFKGSNIPRSQPK